MADVHPTAVIHGSAQLADDVTIGPFVVVEAGVTVGSGTTLLPGTVLHTGSRVGSDCRLGPYVTLGGHPMDTAFRGEESFAVVGDRVHVREFTTIHRATGEGQTTEVGDDSLLMTSVHVSHNSRVGRGVTMASGVQLGGHSQLGDYCFLGASASLHQFTRVGHHAMIAALAGLNRDILPWSLGHGHFARHYGLNRVGLRRREITGDAYREIETAMRLLRRGRKDELAELDTPAARELLQFIATSRRGISAFGGGGKRE